MSGVFYGSQSMVRQRQKGNQKAFARLARPSVWRGQALHIGNAERCGLHKDFGGNFTPVGSLGALAGLQR